MTEQKRGMFTAIIFRQMLRKNRQDMRLLRWMSRISANKTAVGRMSDSVHRHGLWGMPAVSRPVLQWRKARFTVIP